MIDSLKKRITIQKSNLKKDENGNHTLEWRDYYDCFAYVNNLSGSEYYEAAKTNRQNELYFVIRYSSEAKNIDCLDEKGKQISKTLDMTEEILIMPGTYEIGSYCYRGDKDVTALFILMELNMEESSIK